MRVLKVAIIAWFELDRPTVHVYNNQYPYKKKRDSNLMDVINVRTYLSQYENMLKIERMVLNDHLHKGHGKKHFKGLCFDLI